jgi:hypothetical protein
VFGPPKNYPVASPMVKSKSTTRTNARGCSTVARRDVYNDIECHVDVIAAVDDYNCAVENVTLSLSLFDVSCILMYE